MLYNIIVPDSSKLFYVTVTVTCDITYNPNPKFKIIKIKSTIFNSNISRLLLLNDRIYILLENNLYTQIL